MIKYFAISSGRHCMVISSIAAFESFKEKKIINCEKVNTSFTSFLLIFWPCIFQRPSHLVKSHSTSYWATGNCRFLFLFLCLAQGSPQVLHSIWGCSSVASLWRRAGSDLPSGHVLFLFGKSVEWLQSDAVLEV